MYVRYEVRKAVRIPVELIAEDWDEVVTLTSADMSPRGCYLPSRILLDKGTSVVVSFRLGTGAQEWTLFGEVVRAAAWRRASDPYDSGFAVRFVGTRPMERLRLRERLRGLPPPLPRQAHGKLPGPFCPT